MSPAIIRQGNLFYNAIVDFNPATFLENSSQTLLHRYEGLA